MSDLSSKRVCVKKCMLSYAPIYRRYNINTEFCVLKVCVNTEFFKVNINDLQ